MPADTVHLLPSPDKARGSLDGLGGGRSPCEERWIGPDVADEIRRLACAGARHVVVAPIGFVCDHVEVLYDLDVDAREMAAACGVGFHRATTVGDHPAFIGMLAALVRAELAGAAG